MGRSNRVTYRTLSSDETIACGAAFGRRLLENAKGNEVVCLSGDLASGKTTFIKGLSAEVAGISIDSIHSPTFVYLHIYSGKQTVYHFDLYRLSCKEEFLMMGFDEMLEAGGICCIEWSERISDLLPADCIRVEFKTEKDGVRVIDIID